MKKMMLTLPYIILLLSFGAGRLYGQTKYQIVPKTLDFGAVKIGSSKSLHVTFRNNDISRILIFNILSENLNFTVSPGNGVANANDSLTINVTFQPVAKGLKTANIILTTNAASPYDTVFVSGSGVGADAVENPQPESIVLFQNYPNPLRTQSTIRFTLPARQWATVSVYDALGREVSVLASGMYEAGEHQAQFEAGNLPNGVYTYVLRTGNVTLSKKMIVQK